MLNNVISLFSDLFPKFKITIIFIVIIIKCIPTYSLIFRQLVLYKFIQRITLYSINLANIFNDFSKYIYNFNIYIYILKFMKNFSYYTINR